MVSGSSERWFYTSGVISIWFCSTLFFALLSYMSYRVPVFKVSSDEGVAVDVEFEQPASFEPIIQPLQETSEIQEVRQATKAASINELFGDINSSVNPDELLQSVKNAESYRINLPALKTGAEVIKGADSRLDKKAGLTEFKPISTANGAGQSKADAKGAKALENKYYAEVLKRLNKVWHPPTTDSGKIGFVELRIERSGAMSYKIKSVTGNDQQFRDRLAAGLDTVGQLDPPPRLLTIDVKFEAKE